jgi:hypothetical protein
MDTSYPLFPKKLQLRHKNKTKKKKKKKKPHRWKEGNLHPHITRILKLGLLSNTRLGNRLSMAFHYSIALKFENYNR